MHGVWYISGNHAIYMHPYTGPLCGVCGNGTVITAVRFTCSDNCVIPNEYTTYILTAALGIIVHATEQLS